MIVDATVTAFRAGMAVAVVLCIAGSLLAFRGLQVSARTNAAPARPTTSDGVAEDPGGE